jgi:vancomycin resistance protein VanJ
MMPKLNRKTHIWLYGLTCIYGAILVALAVLNLYGSDRWWFGNVNLFLPQLIWLIPGVLLACLAFVVSRQCIWAPVLCMVWVLGPIMGFCCHVHSTSENAEGIGPIRVMSCNIKFGQRDISSLVDDISNYSPDIVMLQDANLDMLSNSLKKLFSKYNVRFRPDGKYIVASKFPLGAVDIRTIPYRGEPHSCLRCQVYIGSNAVTLYDVHFESPRDGLYEFITAWKHPGSYSKAILDLKNNLEDRLSQARELRKLILLEQGPVIVAGDLNSSVASLVCKKLRSAGVHDAFDEGGSGYGYTYGHDLLRNKHPWLTFSWMRIDHILISSQLKSVSCWTGTSEASDHRPVYSDLIFKKN